MKNKGLLSIEKDIIKCEKVTGKNEVILGWPRLRFLAIRVVVMGAIPGQSEAFKAKFIEFLYSEFCFF